jgi:hypothetical protein
MEYSVSSLIVRATQKLTFKEAQIVAIAILELFENLEHDVAKSILREKFGTVFTDSILEYEKDI